MSDMENNNSPAPWVFVIGTVLSIILLVNGYVVGFILAMAITGGISAVIWKERNKKQTDYPIYVAPIKQETQRYEEEQELKDPSKDILTISEAKEMQAYIPFSTMQKVWDAKSQGKSYIMVSPKSLNSWRKKYKEDNYTYDVLLLQCMENNNLGSEYEEQGDIASAIEVYEKNIKPGSYPACHAYDRLLVIYRRQKDYENERRVCELAISALKKNDKYRKRLEKIKMYIGQQS